MPFFGATGPCVLPCATLPALSIAFRGILKTRSIACCIEICDFMQRWATQPFRELRCCESISG
jgi:hypothetical protein